MDVATFERLAADGSAPALVKAAALYRGDVRSADSIRNPSLSHHGLAVLCGPSSRSSFSGHGVPRLSTQGLKVNGASVTSPIVFDVPGSVK